MIVPDLTQSNQLRPDKQRQLSTLPIRFYAMNGHDATVKKFWLPVYATVSHNKWRWWQFPGCLQASRLGPKVGSHLALFCIHHVNRVNSCNDSIINIVIAIVIIIIIIIINPLSGVGLLATGVFYWRSVNLQDGDNVTRACRHGGIHRNL